MKLSKVDATTLVGAVCIGGVASLAYEQSKNGFFATIKHRETDTNYALAPSI